MFGTKTKEYLQCEWLLLLGRAIISSSCYNLSTPSSKQRSVENKMASEVFITRRGGSGGNDFKTMINLHTDEITTNQVWTAPQANGQKFIVRIFGGGGSSITNSGTDALVLSGGSGWMNNNSFTISKGATVEITIGDGAYSVDGGVYGYVTHSGGTSAFGGYLSAPGGGAAVVNPSGSFGGSGGAGGGVRSDRTGGGGKGYQFGGGSGDIGGDGGVWGGGGGGNVCGGKGGTYGGGGGCWGSTYISTKSKGGTYGGNGGAITDGESGTNTMTRSDIDVDLVFNGSYLRGNGSGGKVGALRYGGGGGGGGFGGNGGNGATSASAAYMPGGGGGGYCCQGCDAPSGIWGGGGGGYGYFSPETSDWMNARDGIGYYGYGYRSRAAYKGSKGICIIQYYV